MSTSHRLGMFFAACFVLVTPAVAQKPVPCPGQSCTFRTPDGNSAAAFDKANHRNITPPKGSKETTPYQVFDCDDSKCTANGCHCFIWKETLNKGKTTVNQLFDGDSSTTTNKHKLTVKMVDTDEKTTAADKNTTFKYTAVCASNKKEEVWENEHSMKSKKSVKYAKKTAQSQK